MPGIFLWWSSPLDVVGAVTPLASEVISLLLVRILHPPSQSGYRSNGNKRVLHSSKRTPLLWGGLTPPAEDAVGVF